MNGDLFDFNQDYSHVNTSSAKDVTVFLSGVNKRKICSRVPGSIFESFKDVSDDGIIHQYGPTFCDNLNGKLADFPETYEGYEKLLAGAQHYLAIKDRWGMNIAVRAYVNTIVPKRPYLGYPPNGSYTEVFDLSTEKKIEAEASVMETLGVEHHTYQSEDKLCLVMWAQNKNNGGNVTDYVYGGFNFQLCQRNFPGMQPICQFKRKVFLKLSGLCKKSPVDRIYSLIEPKFDPNEGKSWDDFYRFGTFSGIYLA